MQRAPSCACAGAPAPASALNATMAANNDAVLCKLLIMISPFDADKVRRHLACKAAVFCKSLG